MVLKVSDIHTYYGDAHILYGVCLEVKKGEIVCLLGRNGAGKSTTMKSIIGIAPPKAGTISFKNEDITQLTSFKRVRRGIGYVPEDRRVFADLTVQENLEVATLKSPNKTQWTVERVFSYFPILQVLGSRKAGNLSGGEQQALAIARALMGNPEVLLLDEPTEGLAPMIVKELMDTIVRIKEDHAILLAEQNARFALRVADRGYILEKGRVTFGGPAKQLCENDEVRERYLAV